MDWSEIVDNPYLRDLPFKIEQDRYGNLLMSPANNQHGYYQVEIAATLRQLMQGGRAIVESSAQTTHGVKVPDVVWHSDDFGSRQGTATPFTEAPEICVEVLSPSNSMDEIDEIDEKRALYFEAGAQEVWLCHDDGRMEFYTPSGKTEASPHAPEFPQRIA